MHLSAGDRLGPYEVVAPLGAGAMGEVYRGRDTRLDRWVAIKLLSGALSADSDLLRRFEQEARAAGSLNHPNVLVVYDVGSHDGRPYLVCELLEGETLAKRLAGGRLSVRKVIDYSTQIARGLAAAHSKGIVHRDLKPENLFLTRDGQIKILDFGLAKLSQQAPAGGNEPTLLMQTSPGMVMGTPGYMSPEQVRGEAVDHRSDLFSFGAVLYEMLAGRRAFTGGSVADVMTAVLREEPPAIAEVSGQASPALERIVRHCLEKSPEARVHSAHDLAFDLEALSGEAAAGSAARPPLSPPAWRRSVLLAVAGSLALAGGMAGFLTGRAARTDVQLPIYHRITFRHGILDAARFAPGGGIVFSAAWDGQPRAVFQQAAGALDAQPLPLPPANLFAVSPAGELAIMLNCKQRYVGHCLGTLATAPLSGGAPRELQENVQQADWSADGQALALVLDDQTTERLELPAGKVLYRTAGHISFPRVSPRGDRIAFFDHPTRLEDRATLAVVDLAGKKTTLTTDLEGGAQGLAWTPSGDEVWFTAARNSGSDRALYAASLSGKGRSIAAVPGSLTLQDIAADGRVLLATDTSSISIYALPPGESKERDLSWLNWSVIGDLSDDGSTLLFDEQGGGATTNHVVCLRKTDGSPVVRLGEGSADALSPDGRWVLSRLPAPGAPYVMLPTHAGNPRPIPPHGLQPFSSRRAAWFPDGKHIAFVATAPGHAARVWMQDVDGGAPVALTPEGFRFLRARPISPDGRHLFAGSVDRYMIFPVAGGEPRPVPGIKPPQMLPIRWSADGRHLFVREAEKPYRIFLLDLATGQQTLWTQLAPTDQNATSFAPWLSADGKSYAYNLERDLSVLFLVEGLR